MLKAIKERIEIIRNGYDAWERTRQQSELDGVLARIEEPNFVGDNETVLVGEINRDQIYIYGNYRLGSIDSMVWKRKGDEVQVVVTYIVDGVEATYRAQLQIVEGKRLAFISLDEEVRSSLQDSSRTVDDQALKIDILELIVDGVEFWEVHNGSDF